MRNGALFLWLCSGAIATTVSLAEAARRKEKDHPLRVRQIEVEVLDVFDTHRPSENYPIFRIANAIHFRTRDSIIRGFLLAKEGEATNLEKLDESERILRAQSFIKSAEITTRQAPNNQVDLLVRTQDTWTLQPQINYKSEGGENKFSTGFLEENFLGYGKLVSYFYKKDRDGVAHEFEYEDPLVLGTRLTLKTGLEIFPTGNAQRLALSHPFFSITTRFAGGFGLHNETRLQTLFENGQEVNRYQRDAFSLNPNVGMRLAGDATRVHRLNLTYRYEEEVFTPEQQTIRATMPRNKTLSGPFMNWTYDESNFIKETFIDKAERVEDFNLGQRLNVGMGYYRRNFFGSSENSIPFEVSNALGFGGEGSWFGTASAGSSGRYYLYEEGQPGGRPTNTVYFGNLNLYGHGATVVPVTGVIHLESAYVQNADTLNQLELGGDTGLRGYKNRAFTGNKSMLINIEGRIFHPREFLKLFYLGAAAFMDAGQVQPRGQDMSLNDMQANVGAGFRLGLSRASGGSVIRIDLAYALRRYPGEDRMVLSISTGPGFKSSGNTFSKYPGTPSL